MSDDEVTVRLRALASVDAAQTPRATVGVAMIAGPGVPAGGATGEILAKNSAVDLTPNGSSRPSGGGGVTDGDKGDIVVSGYRGDVDVRHGGRHGGSQDGARRHVDGGDAHHAGTGQRRQHRRRRQTGVDGAPRRRSTPRRTRPARSTPTRARRSPLSPAMPAPTSVAPAPTRRTRCHPTRRSRSPSARRSTGSARRRR